jgi:hypothetical protein
MIGLLPAASETLNVWWSWEWGLAFGTFDVLPKLGGDIEGLEEPQKYKTGSKNPYSVSFATVAEHATTSPSLICILKHQHH